MCIFVVNGNERNGCTISTNAMGTLSSHSRIKQNHTLPPTFTLNNHPPPFTTQPRHDQLYRRHLRLRRSSHHLPTTPTVVHTPLLSLTPFKVEEWYDLKPPFHFPNMSTLIPLAMVHHVTLSLWKMERNLCI